jgi:hypothetical protein
MRSLSTFATTLALACITTTAVHAACTGSNGRGWGSGNGAGKFQMAASDKTCRIGFTNIINDKQKTCVPATR